MKVDKLQDLKRAIGTLLSDNKRLDAPRELIYSRGLEHPKFKITLEEVENNFFIDSKGNKWTRVKEDDKESDLDD